MKNLGLYYIYKEEYTKYHICSKGVSFLQQKQSIVFNVFVFGMVHNGQPNECFQICLICYITFFRFNFSTFQFLPLIFSVETQKFKAWNRSNSPNRTISTDSISLLTKRVKTFFNISHISSGGKKVTNKVINFQHKTQCTSSTLLHFQLCYSTLINNDYIEA